MQIVCCEAHGDDIIDHRGVGLLRAGEDGV